MLKTCNGLFSGLCFTVCNLYFSSRFTDVNGKISRPLSGHPLIQRLVVLAPNKLCFTLPRVWSRGLRSDLPPVSPLTRACQSRLPWQRPEARSAATGPSIRTISFTNKSNWLKCFVCSSQPLTISPFHQKVWCFFVSREDGEEAHVVPIWHSGHFHLKVFSRFLPCCFFPFGGCLWGFCREGLRWRMTRWMISICCLSPEWWILGN